MIASELVSNVIRHGGGTGRVILWRHGSEIYCQVHDHGPGITDPNIGSTAPDLTASHGRGLWMCRQMTTDLIITWGEGHPGTTVTAVLPVEATPDADGRSRASHRSAPIGTVRSGSGRARDVRQDHHTHQSSHHRSNGRG